MIIDLRGPGADEAPMPTSQSECELDLPAIALWAAWVGTLMRQASERAADPSDRWVLEGAASDAAWLRQQVEQASGGWLDEGQVATVRGIYDLWAANHDRHEELAARVDPEGHRRWKDRSAAARPLRGVPLVSHRPTPRYIGDPDAQMAGSGASMASASSSE